MIVACKSSIGLRPPTKRSDHSSNGSRDLFFADPDAFGLMSPPEIAVEAHVSEATIFRLCKAIGLHGFRELRDHLVQ